MRILFIGDVQGQGSVSKLRGVVPELRRAEGVDLVIVNGENSADGNGITPVSANMLFENGADVITTGNHAFKRKEMDSMFNDRAEVLRPANYGAPFESCPGKGVHIIDFGNTQLCVVNIMGMTYMPPCDNPFKCMDNILSEIETKNIIVDFHAEATSEKRAMAEHLSGRVSAVLGTHTHVQTADEQVLVSPHDGRLHTSFICDVGMVGAVDSIIGADKNAVKVFTDYYPQKYVFPDSKATKTTFNAVILEIDTHSGRSVSIKRVNKII